MERFIQQLKEITSDSSVLYSCFAINTKLVVGMKVGLSSEQIRNFLTDCLQYLCDEKLSKTFIFTSQNSHIKQIYRRLITWQ